MNDEIVRKKRTIWTLQPNVCVFKEHLCTEIVEKVSGVIAVNALGCHAASIHPTVGVVAHISDWRKAV